MIKKDQTIQYENIKIQMSKQTDELQQYEDQAARDVVQIKACYDANRDKVIELLMDRIMNVTIELPKVVIGNFEKIMEDN